MMDDYLIKSYTKSFLSSEATITTLLGDENVKLPGSNWQYHF
jgi:hypothetical protein